MKQNLTDMANFIKKPVIIEAFQFTWEIAIGREDAPDWFYEAFEKEKIRVSYTDKIVNSHYATIETLEGNMTANANDFIIKGINGELYPCKPDIFEKTYELVQ